jgi:hypothetical protein
MEFNYKALFERLTKRYGGVTPKTLGNFVEHAWKIAFALNNLHALVCLRRNRKSDVLTNGERCAMR